MDVYGYIEDLLEKMDDCIKNEKNYSQFHNYSMLVDSLDDIIWGCYSEQTTIEEEIVDNLIYQATDILGIMNSCLKEKNYEEHKEWASIFRKVMSIVNIHGWND